jgi:GMP synthase-like glutamine amidotransferase
MKPILIFTHADCEPPGYFTQVLNALAIPYRQTCLLVGKASDIDPSRFSGLVFMGGPGNVNQPEDWMILEIAIIHRAIQQDIPVLGVCLGAQMMSLAMGGKVKQGDTVEVGWHDVSLSAAGKQHPMFKGIPDQFMAFHWHAHHCIPPADVPALASSDCTQYQAFARGKHLAIQFHLEMEAGTINRLITQYSSDLEGDSPCIQKQDQILIDIEDKCQRAFDIADVLIANWFRSLMD